MHLIFKLGTIRPLSIKNFFLFSLACLCLTHPDTDRTIPTPSYNVMCFPHMCFPHMGFPHAHAFLHNSYFLPLFIIIHSTVYYVIYIFCLFLNCFDQIHWLSNQIGFYFVTCHFNIFTYIKARVFNSSSPL